MNEQAEGGAPVERRVRLEIAERAVSRATQVFSRKDGPGDWYIAPMSDAEYSCIIEAIYECMARDT